MKFSLRGRYFSLVPEKVRLILVAGAGVAIGFLSYELLYAVNPLTQLRATSTWVVEFVIGIFRQHAMHRYFTFHYYTPFWKGLGKAYIYYTVTAGIGSGVNYLLTEGLGLHYRIAWLIGVLVIGGCGLLFLKKTVYPDRNVEEKS